MGRGKFVLLAAVSVLGASCAGNPVRMREVDLSKVVRAQKVAAYDSDRLSDRTLALLDRLGIPFSNARDAADRIASPIDARAERERWMARAELLYFAGRRAPSAQQAPLFLASALDALRASCSRASGTDGGATPTIEPLRNEALVAHGYALTRFLAACIAGADAIPELAQRLRSEFDLSIDWKVAGPWKLEDFDRWLCADTLDFTGFRHRYRRRGVGVPLVAVRDAKRGIPKYLTPEGLARAVTVVLQPNAER